MEEGESVEEHGGWDVSLGVWEAGGGKDELTV